ncbi:hypothetical protein L1987_25247 [Smallanthus sonchifolius]|uniref:Uncharacterized protein n=1 Tax=Smallanthus sonchifolius TaxID=185202 RepID=A0ACB9IP46_9ASTR|nr:hypothetical protein L1987_25247 [Smallanthus sonchifolius]
MDPFIAEKVEIDTFTIPINSDVCSFYQWKITRLTNPRLRRCVAAYTSDHITLNVSLNPHRRKGLKTSSASLNHSYLNYGLLAARAQILGVAKDVENPCILVGYNGVYSYGGIDYKVSAPSSGSSMNKCREHFIEIINLSFFRDLFDYCIFCLEIYEFV